MSKDLKDIFEEIELRKKSEKRILENLEKVYLEQKHTEESEAASQISPVVLAASESKPIDLNAKAKEIESKKMSENRRKAARLRYGAVAAAIVLIVAMTPVINNILGRSGAERNQATSGMALDQSKAAGNIKGTAGAMAPTATYSSNPNRTEEMYLKPVLSGEILNVDGKNILRVTLVNSEKFGIDGEITVFEIRPEDDGKYAADILKNEALDTKKVNVTPVGTLTYDLEIGNARENGPRSWRINLNYLQGGANETVSVEVQEGQ